MAGPVYINCRLLIYGTESVAVVHPMSSSSNKNGKKHGGCETRNTN